MAKAPDRKRAVLIRNAQPYDFGGAERFVVDLGSELAAQHEWQVTVVSRSKGVVRYARQQQLPNLRGWWWSWAKWSGPYVLLFPLYLGWQLLLFGWYLQLLLRIRPSVVHPQSRDDFVAGTLAGRLLGMRVVWTDHADLKYIFANQTIWYKNPIGKLVYFVSRWAHAITLVSDSERKLIETALGRPLDSRFRVVYNGVRDAEIEPMEREAGITIFCATSRLVTAKGIGELITAFQRLHAQHPKTKLWLVGDGPERAKFIQQAAGDESIVFIGHSDTPLRYVAAADIFVHPSYHEGFSLSLVEAAMLGKPVIACDVGGNPEIITDHQNGLLVPGRDPAALYEAMAGLLQDPKQRSAYSRQLRETYVRQFNFSSIVAERFLPLYE